MNKLPRFIDRKTDKFFSYKDWREQLQILVHNNSKNETQRMYEEGRIDQKTWEGYCRVWEWCNFRLSSRKQEWFWEKWGKAAFYNKINKTRAACGFEPIAA